MKNTSKLACLFSLWLLSGLCMLASVSVASDNNWVSMDLSDFSSLSTAHRARLTGLYLLPTANEETNAAYMASTPDTLDIYKGLIVGKNIWGSNDDGVLVVIWWWKSNSIWGGTRYSGIAWWNQNGISSNVDNAVIGGGDSNHVYSNDGVIAWGQGNVSYWWVVLWWQGNTWYVQWIVLWWQYNVAGKNGLVMWKKAEWGEWSFVRNDGSVSEPAAANSALIGASNWVLIWTYTPKTNVSLVVNWPVKVWDVDFNTPKTWKISMKNGCLYSFDGVSWHVLGKSSAAAEAMGTKCKDITVAKTCRFGRVLLQEWDVIEAYTEAYSDNCVKQEVTCTNWKLGTADKYYTTCFPQALNPYKFN